MHCDLCLANTLTQTDTNNIRCTSSVTTVSKLQVTVPFEKKNNLHSTFCFVHSPELEIQQVAYYVKTKVLEIKAKANVVV